MSKTLICKLENLDNYDSSRQNGQRKLNWVSTEWFFDKMDIGDSAIAFTIQKGKKSIKTLIGSITGKDRNSNTVTISEVTEYEISSVDKLMRINGIYPEMIPSTMAGYFLYTMHARDLDIKTIKSDLSNEAYIDFYLLRSENELENLRPQLKPNDRVAILNNSRFERLTKYDGSKLVDLTECLYCVGQLTIDEMIEANEAKDRKMNARSLQNIQKTLRESSYFKFTSFNAYQAILLNKTAYGNQKSKSPASSSGDIQTDIGTKPRMGQNPQTKPLNQILFGPPGTGKTYNSINLAVEIAAPLFIGKIQDKEAQREQIRNRYMELVKEGRIVFTTFHQSMSYEDFIEGIKPYTTGDGGIGYKTQDGILRRLCRRITDEERYPATISSKAATYSVISQESGFITVETESKKQISIPSGLIQELKEALSKEIITLDDVSKGEAKKKIQSLYDSYYFGWTSVLYALCSAELTTTRNDEPHILIIDEINRGNVSQIFGELITLIEPDKRSGNAEALEITLPYSKEKFSVPANLYIIGTMNTADRSVEALDTALRRRFSFKEMAPDYDLLKEAEYKGIRLAQLLETINLRIEALLDKDHAIGHSYFLRVSNNECSLKDVFFNEIIPLLQEYFYGNYSRIELVLGTGFVESKYVTQDVFATSSTGENEFNEYTRYTLKRSEKMNDDDFRQAIDDLL